MSAIASQTTYLLKLQNRCDVAERTMAFQFEKPEGFTFKAGQFIDMTLINPSQTDAEGNGRAFSIASAPDEGRLLVATRMRDTAFKRELASMPIGTHVKVEGPFGNLVLHNERTRAAVFLAGGIGITPFRSILLQIIHERLQYSVFCFFANRRPEDAPFLAELEALQERYLQRPYWITIVPTMSHMSQISTFMGWGNGAHRCVHACEASQKRRVADLLSRRTSRDGERPAYDAERGRRGR
jgi:ferredoxin-NADP reductase